MRTHVLTFFALVVSSFVAGAPVPGVHGLERRGYGAGEVVRAGEALHDETIKLSSGVKGSKDWRSFPSLIRAHPEPLEAVKDAQEETLAQIKENRERTAELRAAGRARGITFPSEGPYWDGTRTTIAATLGASTFLAGLLAGWSYASMSTTKKLAQQQYDQTQITAQARLQKRQNPIPELAPGIRAVTTVPRRTFSFFDLFPAAVGVLAVTGIRNVKAQNPAGRPSQFGAPKADFANLINFNTAATRPSIVNGLRQAQQVL